MKPFITWTLLTICLSPAHATSIVALVQPNRILFAADSRATGEITDDKLREKTCKIVLMNDGAFAIDGLPRIRNVINNSYVWDAPVLGKEAYGNHYGNVLDAANEWADRGVTFFTSFLSNQIPLGENILKAQGGDVVDYDVAGFLHNPDRPQLVIASISINPTVGPPRQLQKTIVSLPPQTQPYSSNSVTKELIAAQTERAKATLNAWSARRKTIKESDRNWRALEYLIQQTAEYDSSVNGVNVLEITANQKPHWLQNQTCK